MAVKKDQTLKPANPASPQLSERDLEGVTGGAQQPIPRGKKADSLHGTFPSRNVSGKLLDDEELLE